MGFFGNDGVGDLALGHGLSFGALYFTIDKAVHLVLAPTFASN